MPGHVFVPFHYGYWDDDRPADRAANELTLTEWDPVSKQPHFKYAAARASKVGPPRQGRATLAGAVVAGVARRRRGRQARPSRLTAARRGDRTGRRLPGHGRSGASEELAEAFEERRPSATGGARTWTAICRPARRLVPVARRGAWPRPSSRYSAHRQDEPNRLAAALFQGRGAAGFGLLRDLHDLWLLANESHISWEVLHQVALGLRDEELKAICERCARQNDRQIAWLRTRIDQVGPGA